MDTKENWQLTTETKIHTIMKKLLILSLIAIFLSCKEEKTEKKVVEEFKASVTNTKNSKDEFDKEIYPKVKELYAMNKKKYSLINNIAEKAKKQKDKKIFEANLKDLKNELKYIK